MMQELLLGLQLSFETELFHAWLAQSWPNWVGNFWTIHRTVPTCLHPTFTFFDHSSTFWTSESFEPLSICVENWLLSLHQRIKLFGVAVSICCRKNGRIRLILMEHTLINVVLCFLLVYAINFVNFWHSLKLSWRPNISWNMKWLFNYPCESCAWLSRIYTKSISLFTNIITCAPLWLKLWRRFSMISRSNQKKANAVLEIYDIKFIY